MMARLFVLLLIIGCKPSTTVVQYPRIAEKHFVETRDLPARPDSEKIPDGQDWVVPMRTGQVATAEGVLLSPDKAARAKLWQVEYNVLRGLYETDRKIWQQHRIVYDERIGLANAEIKRLSPSWWAENKGTIAWVGGFIMGAATSVAIVFALENVSQ